MGVMEKYAPWLGGGAAVLALGGLLTYWNTGLSEDRKIADREAMSVTDRFTHDYVRRGNFFGALCLQGTAYSNFKFLTDPSVVTPLDNGMISVAPTAPDAPSLLFINEGGETPLKPADEATVAQLQEEDCEWDSY